MARRKKLTRYELDRIAREEVDYDTLDEKGRIWHHVNKFRRERSEASFRYLLKIVEKDIDFFSSGDKWHIKGYESGDIAQELSVKLLSAISQFNPEKGDDFRCYCRMGFKSCMISLLQESRRYKSIALNYSFSLQSPIYTDSEGNSITYEDIMSLDHDGDFLENLCSTEEIDTLKEKLHAHLSSLESSVAMFYFDDYSYQSISEFLDINKKSIGNAIQRFKTKMPIIFAEEISDKEFQERKRKRAVKNVVHSGPSQTTKRKYKKSRKSQ